MDNTDILISGAGIAGMTLAALLARAGRRVTICDPAPPPDSVDDTGADLRSTAYLAPSRDVLERAGLWHHLSPDAVAMKALRVMDSVGWPPRQTAMRIFSPDDVGLDAFGWNVLNWRARKVLADVLSSDPGIDLRLGTGFDDMLARDDAAIVRLSDGSRIRARLVVGADGHNSPVRRACGIETRIRRYGQTALAFAMTHSEPHHGISTEIYNAGGACVTVPMPDHDGRPCSAVVWMNHGPRGRRLAKMETAEFDRDLRLRTLSILGETHRITPTRTWPVILQTANRLVARRTVLVAEAAHVLPPIGAQGLNTSISDLASLDSAIRGRDPGNPQALDDYARAREGDIARRAIAIDALNRLCRTEIGPLARVRSEGLKMLHDNASIRRLVMRGGLGR